MDNILSYETVELDDENSLIRIIDQTKLPNEIVIKEVKTSKEFYDAIYLLEVRGAPAIGVFAGYAIYLEAKRIMDNYAKEKTADKSSNFDKNNPDEINNEKIINEEVKKEKAIENELMLYEKFLCDFEKAKEYLNSSRPTAVNLSWALNRMEDVVKANDGKNIEEIVTVLKREAELIKQEDIDMCRKIGENALTLVKKGDGLLTHCNAGQLATSKYGTATAVMYLGQEQGYDFRIYCDETRPLLQGARLTAFELKSAGMDVTLQCDNMVSSLMQKGLINAVFVGADRIAANGDAANKIGTSMVAIVAKYYGVPFYVCAPSSTIDMTVPSGKDIPIEMRQPQEVTDMWYEQSMAPKSVKVYNPAFDVTDHSLITAIITEKGIFKSGDPLSV